MEPICGVAYPARMTTHAGRHRVERLAVADIGNLFIDRPGMPFQVELLAHLDGAVTSGAALTESIAAAVESRLGLVPRLRQKVVWPRWGCGRPYWCDDARFDIAEHVHHVELSAPGDDAALLDVCATIDAEVLDRSRPLWRLSVVTGLEGRRAAVLFKLHHAVADGLAAIATLAALLDPPGTPDNPGEDCAGAVKWEPAPAPRARTLVADNVERRLRDVAHALGHLAHPVESARHLAALVASARSDLTATRAPRTSFNRPLGPRRSLTLLHVPLADVKDAAHAAGGTVNDVVLTAVAGGLRALLLARGESVADPIVISVPMSMRTAPGDRAGGNAVSAVPVPVPVDTADDDATLSRIVATTRERKRFGRVSAYDLLSSELLPQWLQRWIMGHFATTDQHMVNLFVTNVAGPPEAVHLAGRRIVDAYPVAPLGGNVTLGVAVLSYAGELHVTLHADPDAIDDVDVMAAGMDSAFTRLCGRGPSAGAAARTGH